MLPIVRNMSCALLLLTACATPSLAQQKSSLTEWKVNTPAEIWDGPVTDVRPIGLRTWLATWRNSAGEVKALHITLQPTDKTILIIENPGNQSWIGSYEIDNELYYVRGKENDEPFEFSAVLYLP